MQTSCLSSPLCINKPSFVHNVTANELSTAFNLRPSHKLKKSGSVKMNCKTVKVLSVIYLYTAVTKRLAAVLIGDTLALLLFPSGDTVRSALWFAMLTHSSDRVYGAKQVLASKFFPQGHWDVPGMYIQSKHTELFFASNTLKILNEAYFESISLRIYAFRNGILNIFRVVLAKGIIEEQNIR